MLTALNDVQARAQNRNDGTRMKASPKKMHRSASAEGNSTKRYWQKTEVTDVVMAKKFDNGFSRSREASRDKNAAASRCDKIHGMPASSQAPCGPGRYRDDAIVDMSRRNMTSDDNQRRMRANPAFAYEEHRGVLVYEPRSLSPLSSTDSISLESQTQGRFLSTESRFLEMLPNTNVESLKEIDEGPIVEEQGLHAMGEHWVEVQDRASTNSSSTLDARWADSGPLLDVSREPHDFKFLNRMPLQEITEESTPLLEVTEQSMPLLEMIGENPDFDGQIYETSVSLSRACPDFDGVPVAEESVCSSTRSFTDVAEEEVSDEDQLGVAISRNRQLMVEITKWREAIRRT